MKYLKNSLLEKYIVSFHFNEATVLHISHESLQSLERQPHTHTQQEYVATAAAATAEPPPIAYSDSSDPSRREAGLDNTQTHSHTTHEFDDEQSLHSTRRLKALYDHQERLLSTIDIASRPARTAEAAESDGLDSVSLVSLPHNWLDEKCLLSLWRTLPSAWWVQLPANRFRSLPAESWPCALGLLDLSHNDALRVSPEALRALSHIHLLRLSLPARALPPAHTTSDEEAKSDKDGENSESVEWRGVLAVAARLPLLWCFNDHFISQRDREIALRSFAPAEDVSATLDNAENNRLPREGVWEHRVVSSRQNQLLSSVLSLQSVEIARKDGEKLSVLLEDYLQHAFTHNEHVLRTGAAELRSMPTLLNVDLLLYVPHRARLDLCVLLAVSVMFSPPPALLEEALTLLLSAYLPLSDIRALPLLPTFVQSALISVLKRVTRKERWEMQKNLAIARKPVRVERDWAALRDGGAIALAQSLSPASDKGMFFLKVIASYLTKTCYASADFISESELKRERENPGNNFADTQPHTRLGSQLSHSQSTVAQVSRPSLVMSVKETQLFTQRYLSSYTHTCQTMFSELEVELLERLPDTVTQWCCVKESDPSAEGKTQDMFCDWVHLCARHAVFLLHQAPLCPPLNAPCTTTHAQALYDELLPLLIAAEMTHAHLETESEREIERARGRHGRMLPSINKSLSSSSSKRKITHYAVRSSAEEGLRFLPFGVGLPQSSLNSLRWNAQKDSIESLVARSLSEQQLVAHVQREKKSSRPQSPTPSLPSAFSDSVGPSPAHSFSTLPDHVLSRSSSAQEKDMKAFFITSDGNNEKEDDQAPVQERAFPYAMESLSHRVGPSSKIRLLPAQDPLVFRLDPNAGKDYENSSPTAIHLAASAANPTLAQANPSATFTSQYATLWSGTIDMTKTTSMSEELCVPMPELFPREFHAISHCGSGEKDNLLREFLAFSPALSRSLSRSASHSRPSSGSSNRNEHHRALLWATHQQPSTIEEASREAESAFSSLSIELDQSAQLSVQLPSVSAHHRTVSESSLLMSEDGQEIQAQTISSFLDMKIGKSQPQSSSPKSLSRPRSSQTEKRVGLQNESPRQACAVKGFSADLSPSSRFLLAPTHAVQAFNSATHERFRESLSSEVRSPEGEQSEFWRALDQPPLLVLPLRSPGTSPSKKDVHNHPTTSLHEPQKGSTKTELSPEIRRTVLSSVQEKPFDAQEAALELFAEMGTLRNVRALKSFNRFLRNAVSKHGNNGKTNKQQRSTNNEIDCETHSLGSSIASESSFHVGNVLFSSANVGSLSRTAPASREANSFFLTGTRDNEEEEHDERRNVSFSSSSVPQRSSLLIKSSSSLPMADSVRFTQRERARYKSSFSGESWVERQKHSASGASIGTKDLFPVFRKPVPTITVSPQQEKSTKRANINAEGKGDAESPQLKSTHHAQQSGQEHVKEYKVTLLDVPDLPTARTFLNDDLESESEETLAAKTRHTDGNRQAHDKEKESVHMYNMSLLKTSQSFQSILAKPKHTKRSNLLSRASSFGTIEEEKREDRHDHAQAASVPGSPASSTNRKKMFSPSHPQNSPGRKVPSDRSIDSLDLSLVGSAVSYPLDREDEDKPNHSRHKETSVQFSEQHLLMETAEASQRSLSPKPFPLLHQNSGASHRAFSAAAQSLLQSDNKRHHKDGRKRVDADRHTSKSSSFKTVNGQPSSQDELNDLFKKPHIEGKTSPHRGLFPSTASAGDKQRIWAGQQNYKAASKTVKINPAFQLRLSANLSLSLHKRQFEG